MAETPTVVPGDLAAWAEEMDRQAQAARAIVDAGREAPPELERWQARATLCEGRAAFLRALATQPERA